MGPANNLSNPNNVTTEEWSAMVRLLQAEIAMAGGGNGDFKSSLAGVLNDLFLGDDNALTDIANNAPTISTPAATGSRCSSGCPKRSRTLPRLAGK